MKPTIEAFLMGPKRGGVLPVLAVKKEKKRAPQALAGGRKGTGKG